MKELEPFLARLIDFLAEKYKSQLVLKGGMLLRLLESPRSTRDIDYAWIRTKKRNLFAQDLKSSLEMMEGVEVVNATSNSRGVFLDVLDRPTGLRAKLEISVVKAFHRPPRPMTTAALAHPHALKPQVVTTMDLSEALSHKIAAALERNLARDLYDLMILGRLTSFDEKTLRERFSGLEIRRAKPQAITALEAAARLQKRIDSLSQEALATELSSLLPGEPMEGMAVVIKSAVSQIIRKIEALDSKK